MKSILKSVAISGASLALASLAIAGSAAQYVLQWDPVADERVTGYTVYYGESYRTYDNSVHVGNNTTHTFTDLDPAKKYHFAVKANDSLGGESDFSPDITSDRFRYLFGLGPAPSNSGLLEQFDSNRVLERRIPIPWSAYNAVSGEARVATGDIDGDGRDEVVLGFGPVSQSGLPGGRFMILDDDLSFWRWGQVDWPDYNTANGETRPSLGDIDGDGVKEIFIGLGRGGEGLIQIFRLADSELAPIGWTGIEWPEYGQMNGETWPALGDADGDGRDELAIGVGQGGAGMIFLKKGFDEARLAAGSDPWLTEIVGNLSWDDYVTQVGETRPALGDLNGDGDQEIVIGLGQNGAGHIEIFNYLSSALVYSATTAIDWADYNAVNGETRPVLGDIDNDRRSEMLVGLGNGGAGYVDLLDDANTQFIKIDSMQLGTPAYQAASGALWPAVKRERTGIAAPPTNYLLIVSKGGTGTGTVSGGGTYTAGTLVTPTATPAVGSTFAGWAPSICSTPFALNTDTTCIATFTLIPRFTLTVTGSAYGTVTSLPAGINCGSDCTEPFLRGTSVVLSAAPTSGYKFNGWSGACTGTGICTVTMSTARNVSATFTALPKYTLTVSRKGSGTVVSKPAGINCGNDCSEAYVSGTIVSLTPTPATGYVFSRWSGVCTGSGACNPTMIGNKSVTAYFVK